MLSDVKWLKWCEEITMSPWLEDCQFFLYKRA